MLHEDWMKILRSSLSPVWTRGKPAAATPERVSWSARRPRRRIPPSRFRRRTLNALKEADLRKAGVRRAPVRGSSPRQDFVRSQIGRFRTETRHRLAHGVRRGDPQSCLLCSPSLIGSLFIA
jgi:hypothetical protein